MDGPGSPMQTPFSNPGRLVFVFLRPMLFISWEALVKQINFALLEQLSNQDVRTSWCQCSISIFLKFSAVRSVQFHLSSSLFLWALGVHLWVESMVNQLAWFFASLLYSLGPDCARRWGTQRPFRVQLVNHIIYQQWRCQHRQHSYFSSQTFCCTWVRGHSIVKLGISVVLNVHPGLGGIEGWFL